MPLFGQGPQEDSALGGDGWWATCARPMPCKAPSALRLFRRLCPMPDRDHPHRCLPDAGEETRRRRDHFARGEVRTLWHHPTRLRQLRTPSQGLLRPLPDAPCRPRVLPSQSGESGETRGTTCGREADAHRVSSVKRVSASANTSSRSSPVPAVLSCSPRTRSRSTWRSRSPRAYASPRRMIAAARPRWVITRGSCAAWTRVRTAAAS